MVYKSSTFCLLGVTADLSTDEVWLQAEEVNGEWRFHDGTPIAQLFCPLSETNGNDENHMRIVPKQSFICHDKEAYRIYHFVCEISFRIRI
jgi:hypothetical protein